MCGIAGEYNYHRGLPVNRAELERLSGSLRHRGPDDAGVYLHGSVGLAHRRLSIIDPVGGHQPLSNEDGSIWVVFNGEIYNFLELKSLLEDRGHTFRTRCDTEVIVHAYEEFGVQAFERLNGIFAIALWDANAHKLVLARDPFGVKPLYIADTASGLLFSSEVKAFFHHSRFHAELHLEGLHAYLTYGFVPSPLTMLSGVEKVRPGHYAVIDRSGVSHGRYGRRGVGESLTLSERALKEELSHLLRQAVRRQMMSDVPVGALLSGGVDSAAVVALMRSHTSSKISTYTVGFDGYFHDNELNQARRTAALLDVDHHEVVVTPGEFFKTLDRAAWHLDEPIATPSAIAMYHVSSLAAGDVKVVLTGQGADEPWAGYRRYRAERIGDVYRAVPSVLRRGLVEPLMHRVPRAEPFKRAVRALGSKDAVERFIGVSAVFTTCERIALLDGRNAAATGATSLLEFWLKDVPELRPLARQLYTDTRCSLADNLLLYGDKMSMAHSIEARVPMLDLELVDFVERVPLHLRLRGWRGHKYLYRQAIAEWVPQEVMSRRKIGFTTPIDKWFRDDRGKYLKERLLSSDQTRTGLSRQYTARLIEDHVQGRENNARGLYVLLALAAWEQAFLHQQSAVRTAAAIAEGCPN